MTFNVLGNDSDPDGQPVLLAGITTQQDSPLGSVTDWSENGQVVFQSGSTAGTYRFTYKASSGSAAANDYGFDVGLVIIEVR